MSFEECFNKVSQIDLKCRFWDESDNENVAKHLRSIFLGHALSENIFLVKLNEHFWYSLLLFSFLMHNLNILKW